MKCFLIFTILGIGACFANETYSQRTFFTFEYKNRTVKEVIREIEESSEFIFFYLDKSVNLNRKVSVKADNEPVEKVLDQLFAGTQNKYTISDRQIVISNAKTPEPLIAIAPLEQQGRTVTGVVNDASGPVIGANVVVKGTTNGAVTDIDGRFSISNVPNNAVLQVSYIGYIPREVNIGNQTQFDITIQEDVEALGEVVVIGYGTQKKANLTGAVSTVTGDKVNEQTFSNTSNALQGMASGLMIVDKGGIPGQESFSINIRGIGTLGNADPLIIVDNVPGISLNNVMPQDIESVSILKDAASAAIYGSRAANGVILITTKRGSEQKIAVNYNFTYSIQQPTRFPKSVDAATYMQLVNEGWENLGMAPRYSDEYIANTLSGVDPYAYPWTNWLDFTFQNAPIQRHALNISGGSERNRTRLTLDYQDQKGVIDNVINKRYYIRFNNDYKLHDKLTVSTDLNYIRQNNTQPYRASDVYWMYYSDMPWTTAPYFPDGSYTYPTSRATPAACIYGSGYRNRKEDNFTANLAVDWEIIQDLHLKGRYSTVLRNTFSKNYAYAQTFIDYYTGSQLGKWDNSLTEDRSDRFNTDKNITLDYKTRLGSHEISAMAGFQETVNESSSTNASRQYFAYNDLQELTLGDATTRNNSGSSSKSVLQSVFGRLNYNFKERYLLEANFRYDGSSRFAKGYQWGFFPSFSAGWRISEESFMKDIEFVNNLKLRGSWGQLGNQQIDLYQYYETVNVTQTYTFGNQLVNGAAMTSLSNKYISWETSTITNVGLDVDLLRGLLSFSWEYFYKKTADILLDIDIPYTIGLNAPTQNVGVVENKGWEIFLSHRNKIGDVVYSISANFSDTRNKVLDLGGIQPQIHNANYILGEGYAMRTMWGFDWMGLLTQEDFDNGYPIYNTASIVGSPKYRDLNNDGYINDSDKQVMGEVLPRYLYGLNMRADYKGFYLDVFFQGALKQNSFIGSGIRDGVFWGGFVWEKYKDRYHPERNPDGKFPIIQWQKSGPSNSPNNFWVQNSSYLRLKNLQIGYNIPSNITRKAGAQKCRVYLSGTNLFTFTDCIYDPEIGSFDPSTGSERGNFYPQTKTYALGLDITF